MSLFFETLKVQGGIVFNIRKHIERMDRTVRSHYGVSCRVDLESLKLPTDDRVYRCRVVYDIEMESVVFMEYTPRKMESFRVVESDISYRYKYTDRSGIDELFGMRGRADDILIANPRGLLRDSSVANIALLMDDGVWYTPREPLLPGTMRALMMEKGTIVPADLYVSDLESAHGMALMNALIGFRKIEEPRLLLS